MMKLSRQQFIQLGGASSALIAVGDQRSPSTAIPLSTKAKWAEGTTPICPYCAVGYRMIVHTADGKVVNIEGDPDHPINQGALCSKGSTLSQLVNSENRITKPMCRAPYASELRRGGTSVGLECLRLQ